MNPIDRWAEPYRQKLTQEYDNVISHFPNQVFAEIFCLTCISVGLYWLISGLYYIIDTLEKPNVFHKYKIQRAKKFDYDSQLYDIIRQVIFNQIFHFFLLLIFANIKHKYIPLQTQLPSPSWLLLEIIVFVLARETAYYYTHRMLHHRLFYKHVHKQHHKFQAPIAMTGIYCHPVEHALSNVFPVVLGPVVMNSHNLIYYFWVAYIMILTLNDHSGYHFPFSVLPPVYHDFHHA